MLQVFAACAEIAGVPDLKAADSDAAMWGLCGVEAACIYQLQSKCNHSCDSSAQAITYSLPDCTIDVVGKVSGLCSLAF